jgi:hypothetical protein
MIWVSVVSIVTRRVQGEIGERSGLKGRKGYRRCVHAKSWRHSSNDNRVTAGKDEKASWSHSLDSSPSLLFPRLPIRTDPVCAHQIYVT